jgi:hypothetical protein
MLILGFVCTILIVVVAYAFLQCSLVKRPRAVILGSADTPTTTDPSIQKAYITGALSPASDSTPDETLILNAHKSSVENEMGTTYIRFDVIRVMTQVVAGTNFLFTVQVTTNNGDSYSIDVLIHRPLINTSDDSATVLKGVRRTPTQ